jgi:hypothetical protein
MRDGGVRPDDGLALVVEQSLGVRSLGQESRGGLSSGDRLGIGEREGVAVTQSMRRVQADDPCHNSGLQVSTYILVLWL